MARYFFHTEDGSACRDEDGTELPDIAAAQRVAVKYMSEMLPCVDDLWKDGCFSVKVSDEQGLSLFVLDLSVTISPAAQSAVKP